MCRGVARLIVMQFPKGLRCVNMLILKPFYWILLVVLLINSL